MKKFILNMEGGKKSLLVNSTNLCKGKQRAVMNIKAQNGKKVKNNKYRAEHELLRQEEEVEPRPR